MIDCHSHLLPGLDDGPRGWEESLALAKLAVADGITGMVLTPHYHYRRFPNTPSLVRPRLEEFRRRLAEAGIKLPVYSGSEIHLVSVLPRLARSGGLLTINDGPYVLVELPFGPLPREAAAVLRQLRTAGLRPVLAHPERSAGLRANPGWLAARVAEGVLGQLNAGSLLGEFGPEVERSAWDFLQAKLLHLIGSDAHSLARRPPRLAAAAVLLRERLGEESVQALLEENPQAVLKGLPVGS